MTYIQDLEMNIRKRHRNFCILRDSNLYRLATKSRLPTTSPRQSSITYFLIKSHQFPLMLAEITSFINNFQFFNFHKIPHTFLVSDSFDLAFLKLAQID
jgi:hypothetical protein